VPAEKKTALSGRLAQKMPQVMDLRKATMDTLASQMGQAGFKDPNEADIPFDRIVNEDKATIAAWALDRNTNEIDSVMRNRDQALVLAVALSDRDAVEAAFGKLWTMDNKPGADFWRTGGSLGSKDGKPIRDMGESADWVAEQAQIVADTIIMEMPFVAGNNPWHGAMGGGSPVAQAYEGMDRIQTTEQLLSYASNPDNKATWEAARELLVNRRDSNSYRTLGEIGAEASSEVAALKYLDDLKPKLMNGNMAKPWDAGDKTKVAAALKVANKYDESIETDTNAANISEQLLKVPAKEIATQIQRSWSLAMTARLIEALDAGDVVPKGDRRLMKSARPVLVLDSSHPLSQRVAGRVAKGLAPLPGPGRLVILQQR
jgi:hypothetical protein